jgi:hypothetical protein
LEFASDKGKNIQLSSFIFQDDTCLFNSTKSLGILLGNNDLEINNSLELLRSTEYQRIVDSKNLMFNDKKGIEDVVSVSSNEEYLNLEELNYICSDVAESLGDGGCDPKCLKPLYHTAEAQRK